VLLIPPLFHPHFGVLPLHQIAHVGVNVSRWLKLFGRKFIFEVFQPMGSRYLNVTDGRSYGPTDDIVSHNGITSLCVASRGSRKTKEDK